MKPALEFYSILSDFLQRYTDLERLLRAYVDLHQSVRIFEHGEDPNIKFKEWLQVILNGSKKDSYGLGAMLTELIVRDLGQAVITEPDEAAFFRSWCARRIQPGAEYVCHYFNGKSGPLELVVTSKGADYCRMSSMS